MTDGRATVQSHHLTTVTIYDADRPKTAYVVADERDAVVLEAHR